MKKVLKLSAAAAVALSAITPVAAFAAETEATQVKPGIYTTDATKGFTSIDEFKKLSLKEKAALLQVKDAVLVLGTEVIPASVILTGTNDDLANSRVSVEKYQEDNNVILDSEVGIKPGEVTSELKVTAVSAINTTGVTLSFKALEEDKLGEKVTVVDPSGKEVAVKAQDLSAGETEAVFVFEKAYSSFDAIPSGVWKINGTEYDFGAQLAVKAVKEAANQVELLAALQSDYFTGVNEDLIAEYEGKFGDAATVADIQAEIDKVNKEQVDGDNEAAVVKAVVDSKTQPQLLAALNANFDRVNADWIKAYGDTVVGGKTLLTLDGTADYAAVDSDAIQTIIDNANVAAISVGGTSELVKAEAELSTTSITKVENLINAYVKPDTTNPVVTTKAQLLKRVAVHKAVIAVNEATTNNILKTRLATLATTVNDATTFNIASVNDVLLPEYRAAIADPTTVGETAADKLVASGIQDIVDAVNVAELAGAVSDIVTHFAGYTATDADDQKAALKELNRLADVSAAVDAKDIDATLIATYITDIKTEVAKGAAGAIDWTTATDAEKAAQIQADIAAANGSVVENAVDAIDSATSDTADKLLAALKDVNLGLKNVVDANKAAYFADNALFDKAADAATNFAGDYDDALAAVQKAVNEVNAVVNAGKATTDTDMRAALTSYAANKLAAADGTDAPITDYINLSNQAKLEVAELVLKDRTAAYANTAALLVVLGADNTAGKLKAHKDILDAVNAEDADSTIGAIDTALLKVKYDAYNNLDDVTRLAVAQAFLESLPVNEQGAAVALNYKSLADVKVAIDAAIAQ